MKNATIQPEDLGLICELLNLPKPIIVFDPHQQTSTINLTVTSDITELLQQSKNYQTCINLSDRLLEVLSFAAILEPGRPRRTYKSFAGHNFLGMNNPDGTLRWFQPASEKEAHFLHLYNGSGWKAKSIRNSIRLAFRLGLKAQLCGASFCLYSRDPDPIRQQFSTESIALFTGTVGNNRKAVAVVCKDKEADHFIKIPFTPPAEQLVATEYQHLSLLLEQEFKYLEVPQVHRLANGITVSNVCPKKFTNSKELQTVHIKALRELYDHTHQKQILCATQIYQQIQARLSRGLDNQSGQLCSMQSNKLLEHLVILNQSVDAQQLVEVAYAHGDFTPWNMFVSEEKVHAYDWELAVSDQRLLYDLFHYIFQSSVLVSKQSFKTIKQKIETLYKVKEVQEIIQQYQLDYWDCYRWYLLDNCSYYLDLYARQTPLHPQAHWLINCWVEATWDAIRMPQLKNNAYLVFK